MTDERILIIGRQVLGGVLAPDAAIDFARAILRAASAAPALICKSCGADRFKEDCKGSRQTCPVRGEAQDAAPPQLNKGEA